MSDPDEDLKLQMRTLLDSAPGVTVEDAIRSAGGGRVGAHRARLAVVSVLSVLFVAGALLAVVVLRPSSPGSRSPRPTSSTIGATYHPRSALAEQLDQIAINAAAAAGDPGIQSVTWVATTRGRANALMDDVTTGCSGQPPGCTTDADAHIYVLQIQGFFTPKNVSVPSTLAPMDRHGHTCIVCGTADQFIVSAATLEQTGGAVDSQLVDLSLLGKPETDSLVGLKPDQ
jgi:hypothetical protein